MIKSPSTRIFVVTAALVGLSGCSEVGRQVSDIVFFPNEKSAKIDGEITNLTLIYRNKKDKNSDADVNGVTTEKLIAELAAFAPALIGVALNEVEKALDAESQRYIATYSASKSQDIFEDEYKVLGGFRFERRINFDRGTNPGDIAMSFCGLVGPVADTGNKVMRVVPYAIDFHFSKAKVVTFDMLSPFGIDVFNPWEIITDTVSGQTQFRNDDNVDVTVDVTFENIVHNPATNVLETRTLGTRSFEFKQLNMATRMDRIDNPNDSRLNDSNPPSEKTNMIERPCDQRFDKFVKNNKLMDEGDLDFADFMPQPQPIEEKEFFSVTVNVIEIDDFGARVKALGEQFESARPGLQETLNNQFSSSP